jgi:sphinganine-1-phosphate aldolase
MTLFPEHGLSRSEIEADLDRASIDHDVLRAGPASFSLEVDDDLQGVILHAFERFLTHNAVFGESLPSLAAMEAELIAMAVEILRGGQDATGFITLGGSESILTALHGARTRAQSRGHGSVFEVVCSETIHPAFAKACHYLGLVLVTVPPGDDLRADVAEMAAACGPATIAMCGSTPQWPHHRFDDIGALAAVAVERDLWFHVDACVGGYLAPFVAEAGWPIPDFDFSIAGVCSMSADLHKWGYAAKPASTVLFASAELAEFAKAPAVDWDCGVYLTQSVAGTRPGASLAAAWSVLRYLGRDGFVELARRTMTVRDRLVTGIDAIDTMVSRPTDLAMVIYGSDTLDTMAVGDALEAKGWLVMRLIAPTPQLQLLVDRLSDEFVDAFLTDLETSVAEVAVGHLTSATRRAGAY